MSKGKFMKELSVEELIDELNFFVPEIQREYVWGHNERDILDLFFEDLKDGRSSAPTTEEVTAQIEALASTGKVSKKVLEKLTQSMEDSKPMNIGFLYSYQPNYRMEHFPESDVHKDVYLIDGQQRFTTLFLALYFLSVKENRRNDFVSLFRFSEAADTVAFDYRVRNLTHRFVIQLIKNVTDVGQFSTIRNSTWFLADYAQDQTVSAMLKSLDKISEHFAGEEDDFFDYLKSQVKFWHFKTEKTDQGEELYITMNSRGKQLEENETLRARFFEDLSDEDELTWSARWEEWQDFFWINRDKNKGSADAGFNEFLRCIAGLENHQGAQEYLEKSEQIGNRLLVKNLSLDKIERYFRAFKFLFDYRKKFASSYNYSNWLDSCFSFITASLYQERTKWFVDAKEKNGVDRERRLMVFYWSTLLYLTQVNLKDNLDDVFRVLRIYWVRYNNHDRSFDTISSRVESLVNGGPWGIDTGSFRTDEIAKHKYLNENLTQPELRNLECAIWSIEDHPLNLDGYQVGGQNITHLVDFEQNPSLGTLENIDERFRKLFPNETSTGSKKLNTILLYYGYYANRTTPYYYVNRDFSNWKRIVRDIDSGRGSNEGEGDWVFKSFFQDYKGESLSKLLKQAQDAYLKENKEKILSARESIDLNSFYDCLCLYALVIDDIWRYKKRHIAVYEEVDDNRLCTFEDRIVYTTNGTFRGTNYDELWDLACSQTDDDPIGKLKQLASEV